MQKSYNFIFINLIFLLLGSGVFAQNFDETRIIDSLSKLKYNVLFEKFEETKKDSIIANRYLKAYSEKAKRNKDTLKIIESLTNIANYLNTNTVKLKYLDSIINISSQHKYRPQFTQANFMKGVIYYNQNKDEKALNYLIKAKKLNQKYSYDNEFDISIEYLIALIKNRLGQYKESLKFFKKGYNYYSLNKELTTYANFLLPSIVDAYINLGEIDSASHYNNLLLKTVNSSNDDSNYPYYLLNESAILLRKKAYKKSIDTTNKAIVYLKKIKDDYNLQFAYYYLGKNYMALNNNKKGIHYLMKLDSAYLQANDLFPTNRNGYEILINHFKEKNDKENELIYVKKLLAIDSSLIKNYKVLSQKIFKEYDTPKLLNEKQTIINEINQEKKTSNNFLKISSLILLLLSLFTYYLFSENKKNKKKFQALVRETESTVIETVKTNEFKPVNLNINPEIIENTLREIAFFESKNTYLESDLTLNKLAKHFDTNSKYLSQIINHYKNKNFSNYLNDLRVNYAISKLKTDTIFRKYTIKAIANEVGFNSTESFTKAFYKNTGIKVSYFLQELQK